MIATIAFGSSLAEAKEPQLYSLSEQGAASQQAIVKFQRNSNNGALLLLTYDGSDPRSFPSMAKYAAQVKSAEARMKPGQKPGLISASPGRNEPQLIGVSPGPHTYGVLFMLIDFARGGILNSPVAASLSKTHLPNSPESYVTVKHYEELRFDSEPGKNYYIQYSWSAEQSALTFFVQACAPKWKDCVNAPFESSNSQTKVLPGISDQEL
jgi:hypothetical protein